ncbi:MAG: hypothetical protein ACI9AT_002226 [Ulvibacter sp.]|jgi:hypothetical protein
MTITGSINLECFNYSIIQLYPTRSFMECCFGLATKLAKENEPEENPSTKTEDFVAIGYYREDC